MTAPADSEKNAAASAAAERVENGMAVGLGTGSTVAFFLRALAERSLRDIRCVATSPATETAARKHGLAVEPFTELDHLDLAVDGADQVAPDGWLIKGGGGAHLREKIVAAAASKFLVICDSSKVVDELAPPIPLELRPFGLQATLKSLARIGDVSLRDAPMSPDGGAIADLHADAGDPASLAARLDAEAGVSSHGLFEPALVAEVLIARAESVQALRPG